MTPIPFASSMRNRLPAIVMLLFGLLAVAPASAESGVVTIDPNQEADVLTMNLKQGDVVEYAWSTGLSVEFQIDRQGFGEVFSTTGPAAQGTFTAPQDGRYTFTFRNQGSTLTVVSWNIQKRQDLTPLLLVAALGALFAVLLGIGLWQRSRRKAAPPPPPTAPPPPPPP